MTGDVHDPYLPLHELASRIGAREVSPVEVTEATLRRIERLDTQLNAFQLVLADRALEAARRAEREIGAGDYRGPLHGVPVALKDLMATQGIETTAGSKILAGWSPAEDATAVTRLAAAGAVVVGKTRMSEFAYSPASNNAHYGPTRNPWNPDRDTGGSSSGSGAAVAAGLSYAATGSDTGGSVRIPAALCGLVGLKPTFGLCSLAGAVTLSWSLDHLGPLTRNVLDAALMLNCFAGHDPRDTRTRSVATQDYAAGLKGAALDARGLRVGAVRHDGSAAAPDAEAVAAWELGLEALRAAGAQIIDLELPEIDDLRVCGAAIINLEAASYHEANLRDRPDDFGRFPFDRLMVAYSYSPTAYVQAQQARAILRSKFEQLWDRVDFLSTPAMPYGAPPLGEPRQNTRYSLPFNTLGWPAIVVPVTLTADGLPLGAQIIGKAWDDAGVLRMARIIERDGPWRNRRPPL